MRLTSPHWQQIQQSGGGGGLESVTKPRNRLSTAEATTNAAAPFDAPHKGHFSGARAVVLVALQLLQIQTSAGVARPDIGHEWSVETEGMFESIVVLKGVRICDYARREMR